jgi:hypothetical protein
VGEADGPAAAEERPLLDGFRVDGQRAAERGARVGRGRGRRAGLDRLAQEGEGAGGEARLHHRALVREVERHSVVGGGGDRPVGDRGERDAALRGAAPEGVDDLARRARARDCHEHVVAAPVGQLGRRVGVGLALPRALAQRRPALRDEQRRPAPDHADTRAGSGQRVAVGRREAPRLLPELGLAGDLARRDAHS